MSTLKKIACNGRVSCELHCKFMVVKESKVNLSIAEKSRVLAVNRSSYYKWFNKKPGKTDENAETQMTSIYHKHKGTYGKESITQALRNGGYHIHTEGKSKRVYPQMYFYP